LVSPEVCRSRRILIYFIYHRRRISGQEQLKQRQNTISLKLNIYLSINNRNQYKNPAKPTELCLGLEKRSQGYLPPQSQGTLAAAAPMATVVICPRKAL